MSLIGFGDERGTGFEGSVFQSSFTPGKVPHGAQPFKFTIDDNDGWCALTPYSLGFQSLRLKPFNMQMGDGTNLPHSEMFFQHT